jgi:Uma2 family endonuclease
MEVLEEPRIVRHRLTVDDYYRMAEVGVLAHDARVELIEGEIIDMAPMGTRHSAAIRLLGQVLQEAVQRRAIVSMQLPLRLGSQSEPEPDLMLTKPRADFYRNAHPTGPDCLLVIEVADTTLAYDVKVKAPLYAKHGVPEYWVIDLSGKQLRRFAAPQGGVWSDVSVIAAPGLVVLPGLAGITIDMSGIFLG